MSRGEIPLYVALYKAPGTHGDSLSKPLPTTVTTCLQNSGVTLLTKLVFQYLEDGMVQQFKYHFLCIMYTIS